MVWRREAWRFNHAMLSLLNTYITALRNYTIPSIPSVRALPNLSIWLLFGAGSEYYAVPLTNQMEVECNLCHTLSHPPHLIMHMPNRIETVGVEFSTSHDCSASQCCGHPLRLALSWNFPSRLSPPCYEGK